MSFRILISSGLRDFKELGSEGVTNGDSGKWTVAQPKTVIGLQVLES